MEKGLTYLVSILSILIELLFVFTATIAVRKIIRFEKISGERNLLTISTKAFLVFSIISEISYSFFSFTLIGKILYSSFLIFELLYLIYLISITLENKTLKNILIILLLILIIPFVFYSFNLWFENNINIFLSVESIIIGSSCFIYFEELKNKMANINLGEDKNTLLTIGIFFCYSTPLSFNSTMAYLTYDNPGFANLSTKNELVFYLAISRIGTICYIIFHYFIIKTFKWNLK